MAYVSADALKTEADGTPREVYVVRIDLPPQELELIPGFLPKS